MPTKTATREEYGYAADQIEVALRRAYPHELEKDELADKCQLNTKELRAGLEVLRAEEKLNENGEGFAFRMPEDRADEPPAPALDPEDAEARDEETPPEPQAVRGGPSYRAGLLIEVQYAAARGDGRDSAAQADARNLRKAVEVILRDHLTLPATVRLERLEAFDAPRPVPLTGDE